jgi:hypothetical protein
MSEETKDPPVHEEEEKMCPYPDGGPGHMGLAIQGFWGSNKPSTARCMSCGGLIRVPDLPVLSAAVLQAELQTERDKVTALEIKWHQLSVKAMTVIHKYAGHYLTCSSEGYDDKPCDCGFREAEEAFEKLTVFHGEEGK